MSKYFSDAELTCHCGCGYNVASPVLTEFLDDLREAAGEPLIANCVCRCEEHNAAENGVPNSTHVRGLAADIAVPSDMTTDQLADLGQQLGADGIGRYYPDYEGGPSFVHFDVRDGRIGAGYAWEG